MKEQISLDLSNLEVASKFAHALSSDIRLHILQLIKEEPLNVSELAKKLQIPVSSAALHVNVLEKSNLVITSSKPGLRGAQKICALRVGQIVFHIQDELSEVTSNVITETMPIGNYFDFMVTPPCGIISNTGFLSPEDNIHGFYLPERFHAQLIWLTSGFLEYRFSSLKSKKLTSAICYEFTFEICSEAPGYCEDWKSDISIWINYKKIGILQTQGDYGGRRGLLNPSWLLENHTQFGLLHSIRITNSGCYIDNALCSVETISSLKLLEQPFLSLKLGVEENAVYRGGFNLFGENFGDHPQNIVLKITY